MKRMNQMCFFRQAGEDEEDTCDVSNRWDAYKV